MRATCRWKCSSSRKVPRRSRPEHRPIACALDPNAEAGGLQVAGQTWWLVAGDGFDAAVYRGGDGMEGGPIGGGGTTGDGQADSIVIEGSNGDDVVTLAHIATHARLVAEAHAIRRAVRVSLRVIDAGARGDFAKVREAFATVTVPADQLSAVQAALANWHTQIGRAHV